MLLKNCFAGSPTKTQTLHHRYQIVLFPSLVDQQIPVCLLEEMVFSEVSQIVDGRNRNSVCSLLMAWRQLNQNDKRKAVPLKHKSFLPYNLEEKKICYKVKTYLSAHFAHCHEFTFWYVEVLLNSRQNGDFFLPTDNPHLITFLHERKLLICTN